MHSDCSFSLFVGGKLHICFWRYLGDDFFDELAYFEHRDQQDDLLYNQWKHQIEPTWDVDSHGRLHCTTRESHSKYKHVEKYID